MAAPAHDLIQNAYVLPADFFSTALTFMFEDATMDSKNGKTLGDMTVWYKWIQPTSGSGAFTLSTGGSTRHAVFRKLVESPVSLDDLVMVGGGNPSGVYYAKPLEEFYIGVWRTVSTATSHTISIVDRSVVASADSFPYMVAHALYVTTGLDDFTVKKDEAHNTYPFRKPDGTFQIITGHRWLRWKAAVSGIATFDTRRNPDSGGDSMIGVYTAPLDARDWFDLTEVAFNDDEPTGVYYESYLEIEVTAGQIYYIALGNYGGEDEKQQQLIISPAGATPSWTIHITPPVHDGNAPILGFRVNVQDHKGSVVVTEVPYAGVSVDVPVEGPGVCWVTAFNEVGESSPATYLDPSMLEVNLSSVPPTVWE